MRAFLVAALSALLLGATPTTQPTVRSLSDHPVIGLLGLPLGTVTEIRATVIAGKELHMKAYDGSYLLQVTEVAGRAVDRPFHIEFIAPSYTGVELPRDPFELYEMKMGKRTGQLDPNQIAELQNGYVGKQFHLLVYETGGYSGRPNNIPQDVPSWQDHAFLFSTSLVVLAKRQ